MTEQSGLVSAYLLDGHGGGRRVAWDEIERWKPEHGLLWLHVDIKDSHGRRWITEESGIDPLITAALVAEETRPRAVVTRDGLLATLRGVNLNPGADPEDMVSIRLWIDGKRIVSARLRHLLSIDDLCRSIDGGTGPKSAGEFVVALAGRLTDRMADVLDTIDDQVDDLEGKVLTLQSHQLRPQIANVRREIITLRRYLAPQREALMRLYSEAIPWIDDLQRMQLREITDRATRYVEDLDSARERAAVTQEELASRLSEQMDRRMYVLSMVAALFLPLGFLTGLLGVNLGGIPGSESIDAFWAFSAALIVLVVAQLVIFRWKRWF